jgi:hypothetical protein
LQAAAEEVVKKQQAVAQEDYVQQLQQQAEVAH